MRKISKELFLNLVGEQIFTVDYTKKNGEAVVRVYKVDPESKQVYEDTNYNYITVYDVNKQDYRTLNLDTIFEVQFGDTSLSRDDLTRLTEESIDDIRKKMGISKTPLVPVDKKVQQVISNALFTWNKKCIYGNGI